MDASGSVGVNATRRRREPSHSTHRTPSMRLTPRTVDAVDDEHAHARQVAADVSVRLQVRGDARHRRSAIDADRKARGGRVPRCDERSCGHDYGCADHPTETFFESPTAQPLPAITRAR